MSAIIVEDIREVSNKQLLIIVTANPFFDTLTKNEMENFIGRKIRFSNNKLVVSEFEILDIQFSTSLAGFKNVFFAFSLKAKDKISLNDVMTFV